MVELHLSALFGELCFWEDLLFSKTFFPVLCIGLILLLNPPTLTALFPSTLPRVQCLRFV